MTMPKNLEYVSEHFNVSDYQRRLKLLRLAIEPHHIRFAERIGIDYKRWSNYERGYPMPRTTAMRLYDVLGVSVEWLWYGTETTMPKALLATIKDAAAERQQLDEAEQRLREAQAAVDAAKKKLAARKKRKRVAVKPDT
jgi:transcriptional regulator with XRE-family HTH domain